MNKCECCGREFKFDMMVEGLKKLAADKEYFSVFNRIISEGYDAIDADVWFQYALFGKVVYC